MPSVLCLVLFFAFCFRFALLCFALLCFASLCCYLLFAFYNKCNLSLCMGIPTVGYCATSEALDQPAHARSLVGGLYLSLECYVTIGLLPGCRLGSEAGGVRLF